MAVLFPKTVTETARLRVPIPAALAAEIEDVRRAADGHGLTFDVAAICSAALARAVKEARTELARLVDHTRAGQKPADSAA
jgi:hypothetical protein